MRQSGRLCWVLAVTAAAGCFDTNPAGPEGNRVEARLYLNGALDVMEFNSIRRFDIDWVQFRATAIEEAGNAKTPAETYPAIRSALERIGDNHSFFQVGGVSKSPAVVSEDPTTELIGGAIGYIEVPADSRGGLAANQLAALYHRLIEQVDTVGVCAWVVDLRGNTGGNIWPMLAGVGPILGSGLLGSFVYPDSLVQEWHYGEGSATLDQSVLATADPFFVPTASLAPVAVLIDGMTASAGEGVTVAFRGRHATRSFGSPTRGVSTGNAGFGLTDGAVIFLTVAWMADRLDQAYGGELAPDLLVRGTKTGDRATDAALAAALTWLEATHCHN